MHRPYLQEITVVPTAIIFKFSHAFRAMNGPTAMTIRLLKELTFVLFGFIISTRIVINSGLMGLLLMAMASITTSFIFFLHFGDFIFFPFVFCFVLCQFSVAPFRSLMRAIVSVEM